MQNYQRILIAIDFSEASKTAARRGVNLAAMFNAELRFLHVVEHFPQHLPHYHLEGEDMNAEEFLLDRADKDLAAICGDLGCAGVKRKVMITSQAAKVEILNYIKQEKIDLVVLGVAGKRALLTDFLGGSTATAIVRSALCDVLTVSA